MSDASDFDFPMSRTFREALPSAKDYPASPTFSGAARRPASHNQLRAYQCEIDGLRREIQELRRELKDCQRRTAIAEEKARTVQPQRPPASKPTIQFEGAEVPE